MTDLELPNIDFNIFETNPAFNLPDIADEASKIIAADDCRFYIDFRDDPETFIEIVNKIGAAVNNNHEIDKNYFYRLILSSDETFIKSDDPVGYRRVAEDYFQKKLLPDEHVHHIDGDRNNNDPENLVIMKSLQHKRLHSSLYSGLEKWNALLRKQAANDSPPSLPPFSLP
jgi:hypothetical protein